MNKKSNTLQRRIVFLEISSFQRYRSSILLNTFFFGGTSPPKGKTPFQFFKFVYNGVSVSTLHTHTHMQRIQPTHTVYTMDIKHARARLSLSRSLHRARSPQPFAIHRKRSSARAHSSRNVSTNPPY